MWAQIINTLLGLYLMASPAIWRFEEAVPTAADNDHIIGPVMATFACVAIWEATRNTRWANIPLGAWLLVAPWILGYEQTAPIINDMAVGAAVIAFSLVRGKVTQRFGGGWRSLFKKHPEHERIATMDNRFE